MSDRDLSGVGELQALLGPGAEFDSTASSPIAVYHYPADGTVTVADFSPAGLAQLGIVTPGLITDASLASSGAVSFTVDATQKVKDALTASEVAFGVLMGTLDTPTGTSLDNLSRFENAGVYYGATFVEAQLCGGEVVIVVGGGNSAGQAAVFLAQTARRVHMFVRANGLAERTGGAHRPVSSRRPDRHGTAHCA